MPKWNETILKYNHGEKSLKAPFVIYLGLECLLLKINSCQNNLEDSYTERKAMHEPSGCTLFTNCSFDKTKNKLNYYRGIDYIEVLCKKLKEHALEIINYEKKKQMIRLSEEENKTYEEQDVRHICKKKFCLDENKENNDKYRKVKDHCHFSRKFKGAAHNYCNLRYKVPKDIPIITHNAGYDTHFIINHFSRRI